VFTLSNDGRATPHSRFSGPVTAVVRLDARRLLAVIDDRRLVELDLLDDSEKVRAEAPDLVLTRMLAVNRTGETRVVAGGDFLLAYDAGQNEKFRVSLAQPGATGTPDAALALLFDSAGTALVVGEALGAVSIGPDGLLTRIEGSACPEPLRPAAMAAASVIVACRSGILMRLDGPEQKRSGAPVAKPPAERPRP
jgi:hypothetical protein